MDISSATLLRDLKSIILGEFEPLAEKIVLKFSGKSFNEQDIMNVIQNKIEDNNKGESSPIADIILEDVINDDTSLCMNDHVNTSISSNTNSETENSVLEPTTKPVVKTNKIKRTNKTSGYTMFKRIEKPLIEKHYLPRKEKDESLKSAVVAGELWKLANQSKYNEMARLENVKKGLVENS
jgi:hypothetical protein